MRHLHFVQVFYCSVSTHRWGHISDLDIITEATTLNRKNNITGFLLRGPKWFCQVLEGSRTPVTETMERIEQDRRHWVQRVWTNHDATNRAFTDWDMGYAEVRNATANALYTELCRASDCAAEKIRLMREIAPNTGMGSARKPESADNATAVVNAECVSEIVKRKG